MFPVHWFLAKRSVLAGSRSVTIDRSWLVSELTALSSLVAADPIDRDRVLDRLAGVLERITGDCPDRQETENPT
jgi:hypothetical protein